MHLSSLTNLHWNCYHHSPMGRVLSFTAMRQLSLCILDYLSDSSIIYTAESGFGFFVLLSFLFFFFSPLISDSCLTSIAAWPWYRGKSDASFWTHLFQFYSHIFLPFPKSALFFSLSYRLTSGSGHFLLGWWQLSQLRNSYCSTLPRLP